MNQNNNNQNDSFFNNTDNDYLVENPQIDQNMDEEVMEQSQSFNSGFNGMPSVNAKKNNSNAALGLNNKNKSDSNDKMPGSKKNNDTNKDPSKGFPRVNNPNKKNPNGIKKPDDKKDDSLKNKPNSPRVMPNGKMPSKLNPFNRRKQSDINEKSSIGSKSMGGLSDGMKMGLRNFWTAIPMNIKVAVIAGSLIFVFILALVFFIALFGANTAAIAASICGTESNSYNGESYNGGADAKAFLCSMANPLKDPSLYTITAKAGQSRSYETHPGIDLGSYGGVSIPVYAAQTGKVVRAGTYGGYGNCIDIDHNGVITRYGHLSSIKVKEGSMVAMGQQIGNMGSTGNSTGPHLHFEVLVGNSKTPSYDTNAYFSNVNLFKNSCGSLASTVSYTSTAGASGGTATVDNSSMQSYKKEHIIKTYTTSNTTKVASVHGNGYSKAWIAQSFAYTGNDRYVVAFTDRSNSHNLLAEYNGKKRGTTIAMNGTLGHANGSTYNSVTKEIYVANSGKVTNKVQVFNASTLKHKGSLAMPNKNGAIAYDTVTNNIYTCHNDYFVVSKINGNGSVKRVKKFNKISSHRSAGQDCGGKAGIVFTVTQSRNMVDMYDASTGAYYGSYRFSNYELESVTLDEDNHLVFLLYVSGALDHLIYKSKDTIPLGTANFTYATANASGEMCCDSSSSDYSFEPVSTSSSDVCPNGITVEGDKTYDLEDYIEKVVTNENGGAPTEALKAQAVAARTYALNLTENCTKTIKNSTANQTMAKTASDKVKQAIAPVRGQVMLYNGKVFSAQYSSFLGSCSGDTCTGDVTRVPSSEKTTFTMPKRYLTSNAGHGYGMSQNGSSYMADQGKSYTEILEFFYATGITLSGSTGTGMNLCSMGANFNGNIWYYDQTDYPNEPYSTFGTIATHGCGPTAMAIAVSSLLNQKHDPIELTKYACDNGYCTNDGTSHSFFESAGKKYGLIVKNVSKSNKNEVLSSLNTGNSIVIALMGKGTFTSGGHFITLTSVNGNQVFVHDPNNGDEKGHNKYWNFDFIVDETTSDKPFWIITKGVAV